MSPCEIPLVGGRGVNPLHKSSKPVNSLEEFFGAHWHTVSESEWGTWDQTEVAPIHDTAIMHVKVAEGDERARRGQILVGRENGESEFFLEVLGQGIDGLCAKGVHASFSECIDKLFCCFVTQYELHSHSLV